MAKGHKATQRRAGDWPLSLRSWFLEEPKPLRNLPVVVGILRFDADGKRIGEDAGPHKGEQDVKPRVVI
jgi:hypothetical protein